MFQFCRLYNEGCYVWFGQQPGKGEANRILPFSKLWDFSSIAIFFQTMAMTWKESFRKGIEWKELYLSNFLIPLPTKGEICTQEKHIVVTFLFAKMGVRTKKLQPFHMCTDFFVRFATNSLLHCLATFDAATGHEPTGHIGLPDEQHLSVLDEHDPYTDGLGVKDEAVDAVAKIE
jgi:hypothetical protein